MTESHLEKLAAAVSEGVKKKMVVLAGAWVFEIDPLECHRCGGQMKIKAFIQDQSEIERLCKHLGQIPWRAPPQIKLPLPHAA